MFALSRRRNLTLAMLPDAILGNDSDGVHLDIPVEALKAERQ